VIEMVCAPGSSWVKAFGVGDDDGGAVCSLADQPDANLINLETDGASCSDLPTDDCLPGPPGSLEGFLKACGGIPSETAVEVDFRDG
jgi:hypothetical protein